MQLIKVYNYVYNLQLVKPSKIITETKISYYNVYEQLKTIYVYTSKTKTVLIVLIK